MRYAVQVHYAFSTVYKCTLYYVHIGICSYNCTFTNIPFRELWDHQYILWYHIFIFTHLDEDQVV